MNRIDARFSSLREAKRPGLIAFVTAGDPSPELMPAVLEALVEVGVDLIELGVPFSDPMADGPVIQHSSERALLRGVGLPQILDMVRGFRASDSETPLILMGYLNPLEIYGRERFVRDAAESGVDGMLMVDSPLEESAELSQQLHDRGLHQIHLLAPTTQGERLQRIASAASGFLYYVSLAGVTGAGHIDLGPVRDRVETLRALSGDVPVAVGFGVKDAEMAANIGQFADAVVIGSALVSALAQCGDATAVKDAVKGFLEPIRQALDAKAPASTSKIA